MKKCCAKDNKFIGGNYSLLEGVFRLILARSNEPMSIDDITQMLSEVRGLSVDGTMLQRLIDSDEFYGIRPYTDGGKKKGAKPA